MKGKLAALALILLLFSCNANRANANNIASKGKNMKASDITTESTPETANISVETR